MSFWNDPSSHEPKRNYRFFVQNGEGIWWWVKTIDKPSVDISEGTYQLGNHTIKYPGVATWSDITMVIVDVDKRAQKLYQSLLDFGYNPKSPFLEDGISKKKSVDETKNTGNFLIQQMKSLRSGLYTIHGSNQLNLAQWTIQMMICRQST
jgi:hypothetical protein